MLLSMTGYGEARYQSDALSIAIELRAVNNRHLKITVRAAEPYATLESEIERVIRRTIRRGTLQVQIRCDRAAKASDYRLNLTALKSYLEQVRQLGREMVLDPAVLAGLMAETVTLPGVAPEGGSSVGAPEDEWPLLEKVLEEAVVRLQKMRQDEGRRMATELLLLGDRIAAELALVKERIPLVTAGYRDRLLERVRSILSEPGVSIEATDLAREVAIFSERSDISEETVRLGSHLEQYREIIAGNEDGPGRKLEFVIQEMGRESNTMGSKASDVVISRHVVEIKATLEKIRELIQNVE